MSVAPRPLEQVHLRLLQGRRSAQGRSHRPGRLSSSRVVGTSIAYILVRVVGTRAGLHYSLDYFVNGCMWYFELNMELVFRIL